MYSESNGPFQHPKNVGEIEDASGVGTVGNPNVVTSCVST
mgnify:CR=1 FL=1